MSSPLHLSSVVGRSRTRLPVARDIGIRNGRGDTDDANPTHPLVARLWSAMKFDMTMMLGHEGVEDGHVCREGGMPRYFFFASNGVRCRSSIEKALNSPISTKRQRKPHHREGEIAALDTWQVIAHRGGVIVADE
jgi:hypothetical protein